MMALGNLFTRIFGSPRPAKPVEVLPQQAEEVKSTSEPAPSIDDTRENVSRSPCASEKIGQAAVDQPEAGPPGIYRPEVMKTIEAEIDRVSPELQILSEKIHGNAELKFREVFAHNTLSEYMITQGFGVIKNYKSDVRSESEKPEFMKTAWRASFTHIPKHAQDAAAANTTTPIARTLGVNSEMDALPIPKGKVSHACGHNLVAVAGVAIALAVKKALQVHDVPGTVVLLGTPAEEGGHGKVRLLNAGGYEGIDACVMCHPGAGADHSFVTGGSLAIQAIRVAFKGKPAHAGLQPWEGVNAQDAVTVSQTAIGLLRQQLRPGVRVHGVVYYEETKLPINVIPADMSMIWNIRASTKADLDELRQRVVKCFEGAAMATGCTAEIICKPPILDLNQNSALAKEFSRTAIACCGMVQEKEGEVGAFSTDFGNITHALPALHPGYAIPTVPNGGNHTAEFAEAAIAPEAHVETFKTAKALALTGFRVIDDDGFFAQVKNAFESGAASADSSDSESTSAVIVGQPAVHPHCKL